MEFIKLKRSPNVCRARMPQSFVVEATSPPRAKEEIYTLELKPFSSFPHIMFDKVRIGNSKLQKLIIHNPLSIPQSVCIEKFPTEKGFSISEVRFHIPASAQIEVEITWKPEKASSCRETVLFRSSTGTRSQAYLHGTACSPPKQKKKKWDDKCIDQQTFKAPSKKAKEGALLGKENINVLNSKSTNIEDQWKKPDFLPKKPSDVSDSPIRRQTYIIDSLIQTSQIRTAVPNETFCSAIDGSKGVLTEDKLGHKSQSRETLCLQKKNEENVHCAGNNSTIEVFNDSLENSLRDSSFERNEKDLVSQDFACDSQVDFSVNNESQLRFSVSECFGRKQTERGWYEEDAKKPMVDQTPFFLGSQDITKSSPPNLSFIKCDLATEQPALWSRETSFVNSEEVKLYETQKSSLKNVPHEFKVPQCLSINPPGAVEKKGSAFAFEIKCGKSEPGTSLSPAKLIDKAKRKTMILSNRKLQSTELREKLLSTSSLSLKERVKVKTPHRKVDKERRASKFLPKRLTLTKVKAADRVYQRNPFATLNVYYDQYWMEKQEMAFTNWLNFILTPNDDFQSSEEIQVNSAEIWMESMKDVAPIRAPSKEELSFKTYTAAKQLNRLRKSACQLYQSEELSQTIKRIEKEVDLKKLCIRSDRAIHADLGIKKEMLEMLLSYNPLWLRIGLETVYGEMISLMNNRDIVGLSRFIINRFLSNPELVAKYAHSSVINYYKPGFEENMKSFTLKKFLLLVYFLDVAKRKYLIDHNPCLFSKKSKYKSSRDLLITFSREYLSGEGDVTKHLRYLGCVVKHQQTPIEEFDYAVKNIAVDLRCGLRLGRAVELLLQDWSISKTLRANTLNRLTKIHNNDFIFKALQKAGLEIEGNIDPRDIVDGNREKTLSLLWQIIFKTQISLKVNLEALKKENSYLRRSLKLNADCAAFNAIFASEDKADNFEYDFFNSKLYKENEVIQQLFQWCQNVCAHYGVKVYNFTSSFSDGRALCYLLHHYHPNLLPVNLIKTKTTSSYFEEQMENLEDENCPFLPEERQMKSKVLGDCLKNERWNLDIVLQKAQEIGQIPILSFPTDMTNTLPDEKVVITLVSYINIRLMELSVEIRAARTILYAYRKWRLRKRQKELQVKITAAIVIQRYWRNYKERLMIQLKKKSAITIQRTWRLYSAKKQLETLKKAHYLKILNHNATIIQAAFKGYKARKCFLTSIKSAVIMQSQIRQWLARTRFLKLKRVVVKVQSVYRARVLGKIQRGQFLLLKKSVIHLQACIRGMHLRKKLATQTSAVIVLQSYTRMWLARKHYLKLKKACLCIQERFRLLLLVRKQVEGFRRARQSAIIIQRRFRQVTVRKNYLRCRSSIIAIQLWWKAVFIARKTRSLYLQDRRRVILLQACFRMLIARRDFEKKRMSAIVIQKYVRKTIERKRFCRRKKSAITIQRWWRNMLFSRQVRNEYLVYRSSVIKVQSLWRMYCLRKAFDKKKQAALVIERYRIGKVQRKAFLSLRGQCIAIQSSFRGYICRKKYNTVKNAVISIQRFFRSYLLRKRYLEKKNSAIKIQRYYRSYQQMCRDRQNYVIMKCGFTRLQAVYRGVKERQEINALHGRACLIQKCYRQYIARKHYLGLKRACIVVQRRYRANILMKTHAQKYNTVRNGVISIQRFFRSYLVRKRYLEKKNSAIKIQQYYRGYQQMCRDQQNYVTMKRGFTRLQAVYRGVKERQEINALHGRACLIQKCYRQYIARKYYLGLKRACIVVQRRYRANILMKTHAQKYNAVKNAALSIQRFFRSYLVRKRYLKKKKSLIKIQQYYRGYQHMCRDRQNYVTMKSGFTRLQAVYRGVKERREINFLHETARLIQKCYRKYIARKHYLRLKMACTVVQRKYRANILMKTQVQKYIAVKNATISIQRFFRSYLVRKRYLEKKNSAIKIQQYYRSYQQMCRDQQNYVTIKSGFTRLQAVYRGMKERQKINVLHGRACLIQKCYRSYIARKHYLGLKRACIVVQQRYRANMLMKTQVQQYNETIKSVILIQATFKCIYFRRLFLEKKSAAVKIQSYVRMMIARKSYANSYQKIVFVQRAYRAKRARDFQVNKYCETRQRIIFLQSKVRCFVARKKYLKTMSACILVQSVARMWLHKTRYARLRNAAIVIQTRYRSLLIARKTRKEYLDLKNAAVKVQSAYRRNKEVKKFKKVLDSALFIQRRFKALQAGKKARQHYLLQRKSVIIVQSFIRMAIARRNFLKMRYACVTIQSYYRMCSAQKSYLKAKKAVSVLQKRFRAWKIGKEKREQFLKTKRSATLIQACYRSYVLKRNYNLKRKACIAIQAYARKFIAQRCFLRQKRAALVLQNRFRAFLLGKETRKQYDSEKNKIILLQAVVKGWLARRRLQRLNRSALKIQKAYKSYICRKNFLIKIRSAGVIQKCYKSYILRKRVHLLFLKLTASSTIIQSAWRRYRTQCEFRRKRNAVILLQSQVRKMLARKQYLRTQQSAVTIQRTYRAYRLGLEQYQLYRLQRRSCVTIQSVWRSYRVRTEYKRKIRAVVLLQSHVRKLLLRKKYVAMQHSAVLIQRHYLAFKAGRQELHSYQMKRKSCIKIQAAWRGFLIRRQLTRQVNAVVCIQKYLRKWIQKKREQESLGLESKQQHEWYLRFHANLVAFQIHARQYLQRRERSALLIQSYYRMLLAQRQFKKLKAIVTIQAFWRGYKVRKTITDSRILEFRAKLKISAPSKNILRNRTTRALEILITNKNLRAILNALQELDVCTQLSPTCCERLEQSEGLSIIIDLVRSCNRSVPHKELIKVSTNILLNIAKYRKTVNSIWADEKALVTILDLMKIYRENGQDIFTKCCTLFYIFCHDQEKARVLKNSPHFCEQIKSFYNLLMRKLNIEEKRAKSSVPTTQAFIKRWISSNSRESLPIDPDWLLGHHRKRSFKDPYTAISALMQVLELKPKVP